MYPPVYKLQTMSNACSTQQGLHMQSSALYMLAQVPLQGLVITGSAADSFAQERWITKLRKSLTAASERRQRILAICFGHQLMSVVLGGMAGVTALGSALTPQRRSSLHWHLARCAWQHPASQCNTCWLPIHPPRACAIQPAGSQIASSLLSLRCWPACGHQGRGSCQPWCWAPDVCQRLGLWPWICAAFALEMPVAGQAV